MHHSELRIACALQRPPSDLIPLQVLIACPSPFTLPSVPAPSGGESSRALVREQAPRPGCGIPELPRRGLGQGRPNRPPSSRTPQRVSGASLLRAFRRECRTRRRPRLSQREDVCQSSRPTRNGWRARQDSRSFLPPSLSVGPRLGHANRRMAARLLRPHVAVVVGGHTPACCRPAQVAVASAPYLVHPKLLSVERPSTSPPAPRGAQSSPPGSGGAFQPAPCGGDATRGVLPAVASPRRLSRSLARARFPRRGLSGDSDALSSRPVPSRPSRRVLCPPKLPSRNGAWGRFPKRSQICCQCCQCCQSPLFLRSFDWHQRWH